MGRDVECRMSGKDDDNTANSLFVIYYNKTKHKFIDMIKIAK